MLRGLGFRVSGVGLFSPLSGLKKRLGFRGFAIQGLGFYGLGFRGLGVLGSLRSNFSATKLLCIATQAWMLKTRGFSLELLRLSTRINTGQSSDEGQRRCLGSSNTSTLEPQNPNPPTLNPKPYPEPKRTKRYGNPLSVTTFPNLASSHPCLPRTPAPSP